MNLCDNSFKNDLLEGSFANWAAAPWATTLVFVWFCCSIAAAPSATALVFLCKFCCSLFNLLLSAAAAILPKYPGKAAEGGPVDADDWGGRDSANDGGCGGGDCVEFCCSLLFE